MKSITILVVAIMLCPAFAFAAQQQEPVAVDETVVATENPATGDVTGEAVEVDELYAPATAKDIKAEAKEEAKEVKAEAKEETKEVKEEAKEEVKDIKAEEKEALKEVKM